MSMFEDVKTGLNEAIEYERGNLQAKTTMLSVESEDVLTPNESTPIQNK